MSSRRRVGARTWGVVSGTPSARRQPRNAALGAPFRIALHTTVWLAAGRDLPPGHSVDHANRDTLDNRLENLRLATASGQRLNASMRSDNRSGYRGVNWHRGSNKWVAQVVDDGRRRALGYFTAVEDAARAYDAFAIEHYGEFAVLNFPRVR